VTESKPRWSIWISFPSTIAGATLAGGLIVPPALAAKPKKKVRKKAEVTPPEDLMRAHGVLDRLLLPYVPGKCSNFALCILVDRLIATLAVSVSIGPSAAPVTEGVVLPLDPGVRHARECAMPEYRVYIVGSDSHFLDAVELTCDDDEAAIKQAATLVDGHDIELRQLHRQIIKINRKQKSQS
jgi:hypothetical protein